MLLIGTSFLYYWQTQKKKFFVVELLLEKDNIDEKRTNVKQGP